jgi:transcriptional regulator with PAS, ATPase and Fis domain
LTEQAQRLIGVSPAIRAVDLEIDSAARTDAKVLITGESGVGKEVIAGLVHQRSRRAQAQLVTVNCAAIPDHLLESAIFGHVRGSFTDAHRDRQGLIEVAHRGTIFFDEIGEMSLRMQALLLRFLESGEIQRVGAERIEGRVDVRVIAATNRNLLDRIASKDFREDLYYRLNVIHIPVPPLRERREDIPGFLDHFLRSYAARHRVVVPTFAPDAVDHLVAYVWPGNVRELKNVVERLILRCAGAVISLADLPSEIQRPPREPAPTASLADTMYDRMVTAGLSFWEVVHEPFMARDLTRAELRAIIQRGLAQTGGNYKLLLEFFHMPPADYRRFLGFLRKHGCYVRMHRTASGDRAESLGQKSYEPR